MRKTAAKARLGRVPVVGRDHHCARPDAQIAAERAFGIGAAEHPPAELTVIVGEEVRSRDGDLIGLFLEQAVPPGVPSSHSVYSDSPSNRNPQFRFSPTSIPA